jgi:iron complex outermembrane receptor protein
VSLHASVQDGSSNHTYHTPNGLTPEHVLWRQGTVAGSWTHAASDRSETMLRGYFDGYSHSRERWRIGEVEMRHRRPIGARHDMTAGGGYRGLEDRALSWGTMQFSTDREFTNLVQGFVQDEIELTPSIHITPGLKVEHTTYVGVDVQPSLRGVWQPADAHAIWAAGSRAVRTPARMHRTARFTMFVPTPAGGYSPVFVRGSEDFASERLDGLEAGYRFQAKTGSLDIALFRNAYDDLMSAEPVASVSAAIPMVQLANGLEARAWGGELGATWNPRPWLKIFGSYAAIALDVRNSPGSQDTFVRASENNAVPRTKVQGRVYIDLPKRFDVAGIAYYVGSFQRPGVDPFVRSDARLGWQATANVDLALGVHDLFATASSSMRDISGIASVPARRSLFIEMRWRVR